MTRVAPRVEVLLVRHMVAVKESFSKKYKLPSSDDVSKVIFLTYFSQFEPLAKKELQKLFKTNLYETPLSFPVQKEFAESLNNNEIRIVGNFHPEKSASIAHGYCASILRILSSGELSKSKKSQIEKSLKSLDEIKHVRGNCIFWVNYFYDANKEMTLGMSLGIQRGLGGVISTLSLCYKLGIKKQLCMKLLTGVINQVIRIDHATKKTELPTFWGNPKLKNARRSTCFYGDPGMGYVITLAGLRCNKTSWVKNGKRLFTRGIKRTVKASNVHDFTFGVGACGLSHLAYRYFQMTGDTATLIHAKRWLKIADKMYEHLEIKRPLLRPGQSEKFGLHNTLQGYYLVKWVQLGSIDSRWDSMYGLSNPISGEII